jgi:DNA replication protein DnaD
MPRTTTKAKTNNPKLFEEAREAVIKLETLSRLLTPAELETLEILFDKNATGLIAESLQEAAEKRYEPIAKIL